MANTITVEIAYALPNKQWLLSLLVEEGTTALQAVELSGIAAHCDALDIHQMTMGVFSQIIDPASYVLKAMDRVEIYRPLIYNPNDLRLQRAGQKRGKKWRAS